QQRNIEIELVEADQVEEAAALVQRFLGPEADVTNSKTESVVRFPSNKTEKELSGLLARLVDARIEIAQFRELQTDLEDTFLTITRADQQNQAGRDGKEKVPNAFVPAQGVRS